MNKFLWKFLVLITSIIFLGSLFLKQPLLAVIALVLTLILDKNKPVLKKKRKKKEFLSELKKGRKINNE